MSEIDLNLLPALDALLAEGSVTGAARRLGLSTSAMSRTLARLRAMTGDPLLVRAGSGLVPTPRALAMRDRVREVAREARGLLGPASGALDLASLSTRFTVRANEGFTALFAAPLVATVLQAAPGVQLRFVSRAVKNAESLREGQVDLEIGVLGRSGPEVRTRAVYRDRFVGVVRAGHPLLAAPLDAADYAACRHVVTSRKSSFEGPVDEALAAVGLQRTIAAVVAGFPDALRVARETDLVAQVPHSLMRAAAFAEGLVAFDLPVATPEIVVSAMWHPRLDAEPAHRWLRETLVSTCQAALGD
jgi:DNA-binding transcriptional LysR family regulator